MKKYDIAIIGGDKRTSGMATVFAEMGYSVICFGTLKSPANDKIDFADSLQEALTKTPVIICGIPFEKEGYLFFEETSPNIPLTELQRLLRKYHKVFGGIIPKDFKSICEKRKIGCYDFMSDEPLTILNAVTTAEGAILEALLHKPTQLHLSSTLVLGYGRCGKVLADKLKGLSANTTICSNQSQELATANALGFQTIRLFELSEKISDFEYIFNTIPESILTKICLENTNPESLIIDIASNQIGVDYEAARELNRNVLFCPGLPGKYASLSCATQFAQFVLNKI